MVSTVRQDSKAQAGCPSRRGRSLLVASRARPANGERPVLERQSLDAPEHGGVVRHQPQPETACVSGNEEIVGADHLTPFLQLDTYLGIVGSSVIGKRKNLDVRKECLQRRSIVGSARRDFNTVEQFRFGDDRDADVGHWNRLQRFNTVWFERFMMYEHVSVSSMKRGIRARAPARADPRRSP